MLRHGMEAASARETTVGPVKVGAEQHGQRRATARCRHGGRRRNNPPAAAHRSFAKHDNSREATTHRGAVVRRGNQTVGRGGEAQATKGGVHAKRL